MAAMDKDTRLVMTILFVGAVSGTNVYFYSAYGAELPFSNFAHAVLFGFLTVGGIMGLKACFDLAVNDRMELWLLDRKIKVYWEKKQRETQQKQKIRESMNNYGVSYVPPQKQVNQDNEVPNTFLASIEQ